MLGLAKYKLFPGELYLGWSIIMVHLIMLKLVEGITGVTGCVLIVKLLMPVKYNLLH